MMVNKLFLILFAMLILPGLSLAQHYNIEIAVSLETVNIARTDKKIPVIVKVTNRAETELDLKKLANITFYVSKCSEACEVAGDTFSSRTFFKAGKLKKDESLQFRSDLKEMYWYDPMMSITSTDRPPNFKHVPSGSYYLFSKIFASNVTTGENEPRYKHFKSNNIRITIDNSKNLLILLLWQELLS